MPIIKSKFKENYFGKSYQQVIHAFHLYAHSGQWSIKNFKKLIFDKVDKSFFLHASFVHIQVNNQKQIYCIVIISDDMEFFTWNSPKITIDMECILFLPWHGILGLFLMNFLYHTSTIIPGRCHKRWYSVQWHFLWWQSKE